MDNEWNLYKVNMKYCIPLSSVEEKEKYKSMSENITCRKIRDDDGNVIGILNINNMIPVRDEYLGTANRYSNSAFI